MRLFSLGLLPLIVLLVNCPSLSEFPLDEPGSVQIETTYDRAKDRTTVRLAPLKLSGGKAQYHSIHIAPSFSYAGREFKKPEVIDFEVQTVVKTKLKIDLYVVFLVGDETIFLSSNRWGVKRPVPGKPWVGERLVFRMPFDTLLKITKAKTVEIKMDGVRFPFPETALEQIREFAKRTEGERQAATFGVRRRSEAATALWVKWNCN